MLHRSFSITAVTASILIILSACSSSSDEIHTRPQPQAGSLLTESQPSISAEDLSTPPLNSPALNGSRAVYGITEKSVAIAPESVPSSSDQTFGSKSGQLESIAQSNSRRLDPTKPSMTAQTIHADKLAAYEQVDRERYADFQINPIVVTTSQPTSTFSIDVDSGSYANVRRFLNNGKLPPKKAVRVEEMINYFSYDYERPEASNIPFSMTTEISQSPWNKETHLLHVGLKGYEVNPEQRPAANLVFLIDVSGSMSAPNKLGLVKPAMQMLVNQLNAEDTISIAVYAGASGAALEPTTGDKKAVINNAIKSLNADGSTNGRAGIELAYQMAAENFKKDAVNRVILITDGDFNVGVSDVDQLKELIEEKRESGIALTTLGFGQGNYNDHLMEQLADVGNGAYAYIDNLNEARKVLVDEVSSTLLTIAKDVKIQVEFNPAVVSEYRLIGYENRHLANEDFANDKVDAGDIGAGHTVTALYEVALVGSGGARNTELRYGESDTAKVNTDEVAELRLRYKAPNGNTSRLIKQQIKKNEINDVIESTSDTFRFSAAVAALGQHLSDDKYLENFTVTDIIALAAGAKGEDGFGYRQEFENLTKLVKELDLKPEHAYAQ